MIVMPSVHRPLTVALLCLLFVGLAAFAACSGGGASSPVLTNVATQGNGVIPLGAKKPAPTPKPGASPTPTASPSSICSSSSPPTPGPVTPTAAPVRLGTYNIDPSKVFVAGI